MKPIFNPNPTVLSLFSGCGELDAGFVKSGFHVLGAYDSDADAITTYNANHKNVGRKAVLGETVLPDFSPDVIVAGLPCQGFSTGGGYKFKDPGRLLKKLFDLALLFDLRLFGFGQPYVRVCGRVIGRLDGHFGLRSGLWTHLCPVDGPCSGNSGSRIRL